MRHKLAQLVQARKVLADRANAGGAGRAPPQQSQISAQQRQMLQGMITHLRTLSRPEQEQTIRSYNAQEAQLFKWYHQQQQRAHAARQQQGQAAQQSQSAQQAALQHAPGASQAQQQRQAHNMAAGGGEMHLGAAGRAQGNQVNQGQQGGGAGAGSAGAGGGGNGAGGGGADLLGNLADRL